jgi:hypothetical protein
LICGIGVVVFFLNRIVPGDVVDVLALEGDLAEAEIAAIRAASAQIWGVCSGVVKSARWPSQITRIERVMFRPRPNPIPT